MAGESGLLVVREVKAFRSRDDLLFGLPSLPAMIVIAVTALLFTYYGTWIGALVFFGICAGAGKALAKHDPYFMEIFPHFMRLPRILAP